MDAMRWFARSLGLLLTVMLAGWSPAAAQTLGSPPKLHERSGGGNLALRTNGQAPGFQGGAVVGGGSYLGPKDTVPPGGSVPLSAWSATASASASCGPNTTPVRFAGTGTVQWPAAPASFQNMVSIVYQITTRDIGKACAGGATTVTFCVQPMCRNGIAEAFVYSTLPPLPGGAGIGVHLTPSGSAQTIRIQVKCASYSQFFQSPFVAIVVLVKCASQPPGGPVCRCSPVLRSEGRGIPAQEGGSVGFWVDSGDPAIDPGSLVLLLRARRPDAGPADVLARGAQIVAASRFSDDSGQAWFAEVVPPDARLAGASFVYQALVVDPGGSWRASNPVELHLLR